MKPLAALALGLASCSVALAQVATAPDASNRTVSIYVYMMDADRNKVLLTTNLARSDPKYDDRALHRFLDVMTALEKRGFHKDDNAYVQDWDKPEPFTRCFVYMEDAQAGKKTKAGTVTGSRVWCSDNGASERDLEGSERPKHVGDVLENFDMYFERAKQHLHERAAH